MKEKNARQIIFVLMCVIGYAILIHAFSGVSWWAAFGIAGCIQTILVMQEEIRTLRAGLNHLDTCFSIADAELVRLSAVVSELEDKLGDLEIKHSELQGEVSCM